ncbi:MAG: PaaI family thioesterase [Enhydrobacter sp.]|nr:MAG: PaaI family thioesterase [Enhydrobacter sp.]
MAAASSEPGFGVVPIEQARTMDGIVLFQEMAAGRLPAPPICRTLGIRLAEVELGRVAFAYTPVFDHYNPLGSVHGGIAATLLDSVMGCCIHTTLKAGTGYTTVEIKVNYVRAMSDKTGPVKAEGKVINVGSRIATSEGRLVDAAGKLLAHGTTTCLIFPI